jgi:uncharacterized protein (TIGR02996 family)
MNEEAALLAAIKASHPDDDTCRLVYADWLDEHDRGGHAAATRLAVELRRTTPVDENDPDAAAWRARHADLMQDVAANLTDWFGEALVEWLAGPKEINSSYRQEAGFDRGMLVLKGAPFQLHNASSHGLQPYVTKMVVTGHQGGIDRLQRALEYMEAKELVFYSSRFSVKSLMQMFIENAYWIARFVEYIDFGGSVTNYMLTGLCAWTGADADNVREIRVGPGRLGSELTKWSDPQDKDRLMESMLYQYRQRSGSRSGSKAVIKKVRYCPRTYWRF